MPPLLFNTLCVMLVVPSLSVVWAARLSWVLVRTQLPGRRTIGVVVMVSIATPSIVGAVAFLYPGLSIYQVVPIYTTIWLIVLAMSTRYITWANRTISSAMLQVHRELEEACSTSGVRRGKAMLWVMLPTVAPSLLFSWFWIALRALRDLTIPIMLARPNMQVFATAIFSFNAAGISNVASAIGVILVLLIGLMVLGFHRVAGRYAVRRGESGPGMIAARELQKTFQAPGARGGSPVAALTNVSFTVQDGEFYVLLGSSGSGKTTTLRSIAGLEEPDQGEISIDDRIMFSSWTHTRVPPEERPIAMVFQSYALWPHMNVHGNITFPLRHGIRRASARASARAAPALSAAPAGGTPSTAPPPTPGTPAPDRSTAAWRVSRSGSFARPPAR